MPERFCGKPGHPYCPEHQREIDAMEQSDKDWNEILVSHQAVCEEPHKEERRSAQHATVARFMTIAFTARNVARMIRWEF